MDVANGQTAVREAIASSQAYDGPYVDAAPDILVGYNTGYRVSWDSAVGKVSGKVFADNLKAWSGDHCIHPDLVPGVLFSNLKLNQRPAGICDLGPTVLELLGVTRPDYMDGESLLPNE